MTKEAYPNAKEQLDRTYGKLTKTGSKIGFGFGIAHKSRVIFQKIYKLIIGKDKAKPVESLLPNFLQNIFIFLSFARIAIKLPLAVYHSVRSFKKTTDANQLLKAHSDGQIPKIKDLNAHISRRFKWIEFLLRTLNAGILGACALGSVITFLSGHAAIAHLFTSLFTTCMTTATSFFTFFMITTLANIAGLSLSTFLLASLGLAMASLTFNITLYSLMLPITTALISSLSGNLTIASWVASTMAAINGLLSFSMSIIIALPAVTLMKSLFKLYSVTQSKETFKKNFVEYSKVDFEYLVEFLRTEKVKTIRLETFLSLIQKAFGTQSLLQKTFIKYRGNDLLSWKSDMMEKVDLEMLEHALNGQPTEVKFYQAIYQALSNNAAALKKFIDFLKKTRFTLEENIRSTFIDPNKQITLEQFKTYLNQRDPQALTQQAIGFFNKDDMKEKIGIDMVRTLSHLAEGREENLLWGPVVDRSISFGLKVAGKLAKKSLEWSTAFSILTLIWNMVKKIAPFWKPENKKEIFSFSYQKTMMYLRNQLKTFHAYDDLADDQKYKESIIHVAYHSDHSDHSSIEKNKHNLKDLDEASKGQFESIERQYKQSSN